MSQQVVINRQDPAIEAYRLGLLGDVQGFVRNQIQGQQIQNLRADGLTDAEIATRLSTEAAPVTAEDVSAVSRTAQFTPPDYQVAQISGAEQRAIDLAQSGVGAYQPFIQGGQEALTSAQGIARAAVPGIDAALAAARGQAATGQQQILRGANLGRAAAIFGGEALRGLTPEAASQVAAAQRQAEDAERLGFRTSATARGDIMAGAGMAERAARQALNGIRAAGQQGLGASEQARGDIMAGAGMAERAARQALTGIRGAGQQGLTEAQRAQLDLGTAAQFGVGQVGTAQSAADIAAARARASTATAQEALAQAGLMGRGAAEQGIAALTGTGARFAPDQISPFMSAYEDAAVQQALSDIARQGDLQQQQIAAQAVQAGAFGGSRQAVAEQELARNILEQQGRTAAQMRAAGFESAAQRAQQAFEQQQGRQQQLAALTGQLGQAGAGTAAQAAAQAGQLGLSAEQLAQTGALQGGQLGLTSAQQQIAAQEAAGRLGLTATQQQAAAEQAAAQLGLSAAQQRSAAGEAAGRLGLTAAQQQAAAEQAAGQLGLSAAQQRSAAGEAAGRLGISTAQMGQQGALQRGQLGLSGVQAQAALQNQASQLGLQAGQQQIAAGQGIGSLASQMGQLGISGAQAQGALAGQLGQLGVQQAGVGELQSRLATQDIQNLMTTGGAERAVEQATLEAQRMSNLQRYSQPYQQYGFLSDIYAGVPTGQAAMTATSAPQVSPFQTAVGLGIQGLSAAAGAQRAGII